MIGADLIYWVIGMSCALLIVVSIRNFGFRSLWLWKSAVMLSLCIYSATTLTLKEITIAAWFILYLIPILGFNLVHWQIARGQYHQAKQVASTLSFLHPGDGWPDYPDILQALTWMQEGQRDLAFTTLRRFQRSDKPMAINAMITLFRLERRWRDCLHWIDSLPGPAQWAKSPPLLTAYCRSLGELQEYPRLFELLDANWSKIQQAPKAFNQLTLLALAFGGQWEGLQNFLKSPANRFQAETQRYWLATAAMTAGHLDFAQVQFQQLRDQTQDMSLKQAAEERLQSPLRPARKYLPLSLERKFQMFENGHASPLSRYDFGQRQAGVYWVTWTLIAANVVMFYLEFQNGGSDDPQVLYRLGGLWPPDVWAGEHWRLIAANFLHSGITHLLMNMAGLLILGPFIERILGGLKFLTIYGVCGLGAAACIAYWPLWFGTEPEFTVGASGAIMGLVGAIAAVTLWGWLVERAAIAARRFRTILVMIGVQVAFDFSTPQISITGHLSGMVIGFLVTLVIIALFGFKNASSKPIRSVG